MKSRVFYDVLQDSLQETISAGDKDFSGTFDKLMELATNLVFKYEPEVNGGLMTGVVEPLNEDMLSDIRESFLDEVFGSSSKLSRKDYMDAVATKQNWIFNPKSIRERIDKEGTKKWLF